jgi:hypothetical protein
MDTQAELKVGEVLSITSDNNNTLNTVMLKIDDTTLLKLDYDSDNNKVDLVIEDTDLLNTYLEGNLSKSTLKDFIRSLTILTRQLTDATTE